MDIIYKISFILGSLSVLIFLLGSFKTFSIPYIILLTFIFAILPLVLTPPTSRDELIHHLAIPKLYLEKGKIFEIPFMSFSYFPMNIDLLYLIPLSLGNDIIPKIIHLIFALLTAMIIYSYLFPQ